MFHPGRDRGQKIAAVERREASVPRLRGLRKLIRAGTRGPTYGPLTRVPRKHPSACRRSAPSFDEGTLAKLGGYLPRENDDACTILS